MAIATLNEILQPQVVLDVVSRIREGQGALGRWLGFQPNRFNPDEVSLSGPNTVTGPTRYPVFRTMDFTRVVAKATAPGAPPVTIARNPVGNTNISCARWHMKIPLNYEEMSNLSPVIGPNSVVDPGGRDYIDRQTNFIGEQFNHMVEMSAAGMMRDSLYFIEQGEDLLPSFTAPTATQAGFQVNFQVPSGNKNQLNMLGTGNIISTSWAVPSATIIGDCLRITAAFQQLSGYQLTDVWVNSITWYSIITNTEVRNTAGSANVPFAEYIEEPEKGMDGEPTGKFQGILRGLPWLRWHINDDVLALNTDVDPSYSTAPAGATLAKIIPDNMAIFCTRPSPKWCKLYLGGEYVVEYPGAPAVLRQGYHFWKESTTQPSAVDLLGLLNEIPLLYIPKIVAPAFVVF